MNSDQTKSPGEPSPRDALEVDSFVAPSAEVDPEADDPLTAQLKADELAVELRIEALKGQLASARSELRTVHEYMKQKGVSSARGRSVVVPARDVPAGDPDGRQRVADQAARRIGHDRVIAQVLSVLKDTGEPMTLSELHAEIGAREERGEKIGGKPVQLPGSRTENNLASHLRENYAPSRNRGISPPVLKVGRHYMLPEWDKSLVLRDSDDGAPF